MTSDEIEFEEIYARAGADLAAIPWATLAPNAALTDWLDQQPPNTPEGRALVVACGLGDDAEELARRAYRVTAFDISSTAIDLCHQRFPHTAVDYRVADLFDLPTTWREAFELVVEIRTLQSVPPATRAQAAMAIAGTVAPGGRVFVRTAARAPDEPLGARPWPLTRQDLGAFTDAGLVQTDLRDEPPVAGRRFRTLTAAYERRR